VAQVDLKNATLTIRDGVSTSVNVKIGEGNISWSEKRNLEYKLDKGNLDSVRLGDEAPMEVNFDFRWEFITSIAGTAITPYDALTQKGNASSWVSTGKECEPYAVELLIIHSPACVGTGSSTQTEIIIITDFIAESIDFDFSSGQISVSGKSNVVNTNVFRI